MQCIAFMNLIYLLYSHSAAFSESEALHLLTSSLFKPACFHGSSLTLIFQLCDMESQFSYNIVKLLLLFFFFLSHGILQNSQARMCKSCLKHTFRQGGNSGWFCKGKNVTWLNAFSHYS